MTIERKIASLFRLDDEGWKCHAHPWSVIYAAPFSLFAS
jgi:hypothetical protein